MKKTLLAIFLFGALPLYADSVETGAGSRVGGGSGGTTSITAGTTPITSGTDTRVLFNDGGKVGENAGFTFTKATGTLFASNMASLAGANYTLVATAPAATTGASQAGKAVGITASNAVASTDTAGAAAGGGITITTGNAARNTSGNANGGDLTLTLGTGIGTGVGGRIFVATGTKIGVVGATDLYESIFNNVGAATTFSVLSNGSAVASMQGGVGFILGSGNQLKWSTTTDSTSNFFDTGIGRVGAKNIKFTDGSTGGAVSSWGIQSKALTESSATTFAKLAIASGSAGGGQIDYCIEANDGTDFQSRCGVIPFAVVNKAGTITCTVGTVGTATEVVAVSTGTLSNTMTCADAGSNVLNLLANAVSSLTQTTLRINYFVRQTGNGGIVVTPQ